MSQPFSSPVLRLGIGALLPPVFFVIYILAAQTNPTYDAASFIASYSKTPYPTHSLHLGFSWILYGAISLGRAISVSPEIAGIAQASFFASLSVLLFLILLRRHGIGFAPALIFSLLFGFNETMLENATTTELYAAAVFAVLLALHAFVSASRRESVLNALLLWGASVLVLVMHVGFAFFVLALHLALVWKSKDTKRQLAWLACGAMTTAPILLWLYLDGHLTQSRYAETESFLGVFYQAGSFGNMAMNLFNAPLYRFSQYAGLLIFPAALGWSMERERFPEIARATAWSATLFFAIFSFWPVDYGSFLLPIQPMAGLFAALGYERLSRNCDADGRAKLLLALYIYALAYLILPRNSAYGGTTLDWALSLTFWLILAAMMLLGLNLRNEKEGGAPRTYVHPWTIHVSFGLSALLLHTMAFLPRVLTLKEPDETTRLLTAFRKIAPPKARLVTQIPPYRPEVQSGRETLSAVHGWDNYRSMAKNRRKLTQWLRDFAAHPDRPLFFDRKIIENREFVFGGPATGNQTELPLDWFDFNPIESDGVMLYVLKYVDPLKQEVVSRGGDLFIAEDWGGVPVQWTRKKGEVRFMPKGKSLRVKYWVGHSDISPEKPVTVTLRVGDRPAQTHTHPAQDAYIYTLDISDAPTTKSLDLYLEVDRTWHTADGRDVGVGLYPLEFPSDGSESK